MQRVFKACMARLRGNANRKIPPLQRDGNYVTFKLPYAFNLKSTKTDNAEALQALLHCLVAINIDYLENYPYTPLLYNSGVYYKRTEIWDSIPALYARGYGDCKSLACALVAERIVRGEKAEPVFRWIKLESPQKLHLFYHILVLSENGWEDPSKVLGMELHENSYFRI